MEVVTGYPRKALPQVELPPGKALCLQLIRGIKMGDLQVSIADRTVVVI